ncbi:MAG: hypothetical protein FJ291_20405 [Planctomycetes bacterium]|nr:hypothetical protein [Planctomycetota bacterium]
MTQLGRRLAILGIVMMAVTMVVFGREIERALQARCVASIPLEVGKEVTTHLLAVEPGRGCQVGVELVVTSKSIIEDIVRGEPQYLMRYGFGLRLRALDDEGKVVPGGLGGALCWDDERRFVRDERADASGGRARVLHVFPKFDAPASGKLRVRAVLEPDAEFGATAESAALKVYDNITRPARDLWLAGAAVLLGPAVMLVGVVLGIAGWLRERRAEAGEPAPPSEPDGAEPEDAEE